MMTIGQLTGWDRNQLSEAAHDSMQMFIGHYADIRRIADTLCDGSLYRAWSDIIEKGILELTQLCDMDDKAREEEL